MYGCSSILVYCTFYGYYTGELFRPAGVSFHERPTRDAGRPEQSLTSRSSRAAGAPFSNTDSALERTQEISELIINEITYSGGVAKLKWLMCTV